MLKSLSEAKEYVVAKVGQLAWEYFFQDEKDYIELTLEDLFYTKIENILTDEEMDQLTAQTSEELEGELFYKIPNYVSLLEETTAEFLTEYLS